MSRKSTLRQATISDEARDEADEDERPAGSRPTPSCAPSGMNTSDSTIRITSITANVTACVATIENATSWRGKRTFLISSALSTIEREADCSETEKKIQQASPASR